MARIRTVKPDLFTSRLVSAWPVPVRWTLVGLFCYVDDAGRGVDEPRLVKASAYPLDDTMTLRKVEQHLAALAEGEGAELCRYQVDGLGFLHFPGWTVKSSLVFQVVNRPTPTKLPPCPIHDGTQDALFPDDSVRTHGGLTPGREQGTGNRERESATRRGTPRTADQEPVLESDEVVDGELIDEAAGTAQTLVAEWIDHCGDRPPGRVVGQVARELGAMLTEGIPVDDVRRGLAAWHHKGLHPAALASVVHEVRTAGARSKSTTTDRVAEGLALAARLREQEDTPQPVAQIGAAR